VSTTITAPPIALADVGGIELERHAAQQVLELVAPAAPPSTKPIGRDTAGCRYNPPTVTQ
jgi:hypothetical protein